MKPKRILGIDFGEKRIGLAVSDPLGYTAQGIETLQRKNKAQVIDALAKICAQREIGEIVIGFPINMDGSHGPKAQEVTALVPLLQKAAGVPVTTWDERLSTRQVSRVMMEGGLSRQKQKMQSDRLAATLILQSYLESKRH